MKMSSSLLLIFLSVSTIIGICTAQNLDDSAKNKSISVQPCPEFTKPLPNYYWRKYEGQIPSDAIPGGHTAGGKITYIGQVLVIGVPKHDAILPGVIHVGQNGMDAPFYGAYKSNKYVAILCSNTQWAFQWVPTKENEIHLIKNYLVVGGYENNQPAYIGRVSYANNLIVGKVFTQYLKGLRIATPDGKEVFFGSFEVLVYKHPGPH